MESAAKTKVAIVGLGYVGLSLAKLCVDAGFEVTGIESSELKVGALLAGQSPISDLSDSDVGQMLQSDFLPTSDFSAVSSCSVVILALPTPLGNDDRPDLSILTTAVRSAARFARGDQLWILESTVQPGVTESLVYQSLRSAHGGESETISLAYSPERINPGTGKGDLTSIPKLVAGMNTNSLNWASDFYREIGFVVVEASSIRAAEAAKLLENTYRAVNLALVNELVQLVSRAGIDFQEVVQLAATKPFGFQPFWPGPGVGGHCIPIDPWYLQYFLESSGPNSRVAEVALRVNAEMPISVARRIIDVGKARGLLAEGASEVILLGMTYKADVNDFRNSPGSDVSRELSRHGINVSYHDPFLDHEIPGVSGKWISGSPYLWSTTSMTVILQNHSEYRQGLSTFQTNENVYSAAAGSDQLAKSIWIPIEVPEGQA